MKKILFGSCMAPNADDFIRDVLDFLQQTAGIPIEFVDEMTWPEREAALDRGQIELGWICGLPYVWKADRNPPRATLLAAPVMDGERYRGQPIYFSDVVVRRGSDFTDFSSLAQAVWGYNEPRSHSGYNLVRFELAKRGLNGDFFSQVVATGSHQSAIKAILRGKIDAAAIDSTVLETEMRREPELAKELRVIETFGPSPIPPIVASTGLDPELRRPIRDTLISMHQSSKGLACLQRHRVARFVQVDDDGYDPIRAMDRVARTISL